MPPDVRELLTKTAFRSMDVEQLLDPERPTWINFDPELGYLPDDVVMRDGLDNSVSTYTYAPTGERMIINHPDKPCRINTYGNSYTQCQQVSDGETWQEFLAAHIGEPIRNFGTGGQGIFQIYKKVMRFEPTEVGAEYIIFNVFHDDHIRSLDVARWIRSAWNAAPPPPNKPRQIHGLPWAHLRFDLDKGGFVELPGLCKNGDDLRALCDPEHFYQTFKDDFIVRLFTLINGGDVEVEEFEAIAEALGIEVDLRDPAKRREGATKLHLEYGFRSTEYILDKMIPWAKEQGKKLILLLSYGMTRLPEVLAGERFDQTFLDYLANKDVSCIDCGMKHVEDFKLYNLSFEEYLEHYYVRAAAAAVFGHYNPIGNMFLAMSIKNEIIAALDPKPPAYAS
ncbi:hypothetical protein ACFL1X_01590 [Candidatus Hydrogenedentota bacterium]